MNPLRPLLSFVWKSKAGLQTCLEKIQTRSLPRPLCISDTRPLLAMVGGGVITIPRMTPKERAYATLEHREPDRVPLLEAWTSTIVIEKVLHRPFGGVCDFIYFYRTLEIDFVPVSSSGWQYRPVEQNVVMDEWGRKWQQKEGSLFGELGFYIDGTLKTPEKFDEFQFPSPLAPGRLDTFEAALKAVGDEYAVVGTLEEAIFEHAALQVGLRDFLSYMYKEPSFAHKVLKKHYEFSLELAKSFLDAGAEFILIGDDLADNHGPFMSPRLYKDFIHPYYKSLVQSLKKRGAKVIFHSDGNLIPIITDILDWGIDGLHPIQPGAMDILQFKRDYGDKIAIVGGVDVARLLPFGSEEDVVQAVVDVIKAVSPGGGYVLGSSNSLHSYVPDIDKYVRNVRTYIETAHKFGVYPIQ